jgi:DNA (cytosine-5)-methyltransferase 1
MKKRLRLFSVCSGVGGLDFPFHHDSNFEIVGFSEIDSHSSSVLNYHYPGIKNYGDLIKIRTEELPDFDILIGGTPCQSFSIAGKRAGFEGSSGLFSYYVRILKEKRPRYFIHENVPGMLSSTKGWDFARVQMELAEAGYDFRWEIFNAKEFGVPQNRERVFTLGTLGGSGRSEILFGSKKIFLDKKAKSNGSIFPKTIFSEGKKILAWSSSGRSWGREERITQDHAHTLNTGDGCRTQSACNYVQDNTSKLRKLTPLEAERLMSWPDNYTLHGNYSGEIKKISDSQRYRMCGDGVVSDCVVPLKNLIKDMEIYG